MTYQWKDKVVLITGAATGIGAVVVRKLVETEGVKHVVILDLSDAGFALEKELNSKFGNKITFIKGDVTVDEQLSAAFKAVTDRYGNLDVLINNAALMNDKYEVYKKMVDVNVTALYTSTLKAFELIRKDEGGRGGTIINISSIAALMNYSINPMYYGTKSAVLQFTLCMSHEDYYSRSGVRMITICYGVTDTSLLSTQKTGNFDKVIDSQVETMLRGYLYQKPESAANGLLEVYRRGENGSTWLVSDDKPAKNITPAVTKAYKILSDTMNQ